MSTFIKVQSYDIDTQGGSNLDVGYLKGQTAFTQPFSDEPVHWIHK